MSEGWKMNFKNLCQFPGCADMSQHGHPQTEWGNAVHSLRSDNASLRARVAEMAEALRAFKRYGKHRGSCVQMTGKPCSCGFDAAATKAGGIAALPSAGKERA